MTVPAGAYQRPRPDERGPLFLETEIGAPRQRVGHQRGADLARDDRQIDYLRFVGQLRQRFSARERKELAGQVASRLRMVAQLRERLADGRGLLFAQRRLGLRAQHRQRRSQLV